MWDGYYFNLIVLTALFFMERCLPLARSSHAPRPVSKTVCVHSAAKVWYCNSAKHSFVAAAVLIPAPYTRNILLCVKNTESVKVGSIVNATNETNV
jgi:hypothetical protein